MAHICFIPVGIKIERRADGYYAGETRVATALGPVDPKLGWPARVEVRQCQVCGMVAATDRKVFPAACEALVTIERDLRLERRPQVERRCRWCRRPFSGARAQRMCSDDCRREARAVTWRIASEKRAALRERFARRGLHLPALPANHRRSEAEHPSLLLGTLSQRRPASPGMGTAAIAKATSSKTNTTTERLRRLKARNLITPAEGGGWAIASPA